METMHQFEPINLPKGAVRGADSPDLLPQNSAEGLYDKNNENVRKETVVYGGAFNPPTRAHQAILQACVEYAEPREADVWLLPSASRVDKTIETSRQRRIDLCLALTRDVVGRTVTLAVETTELDRTGLTETYDTVRQLEALYPDRDFTWVFGADSVATMDTWDHGSWLRTNLSMLVIGRPGTEFPVLGPKAIEFPIEAGNYSSTELRRRMAEGEDFNDVVGDEVYRMLTDDMLGV